MYGGNGITTFALPNLQSRVGMSAGTDPVGNNYSQGEEAGEETITINLNTMPLHTHTFFGTTDTGDRGRPGRTASGARQCRKSGGGTGNPYYAPPGPLQPINPASAGILRRQPAAHQSATLPDDQLVHRHAGHIPGAQLSAADSRKTGRA